MMHQSIYKLNPSIVTIRGDVAYDSNGDEVAYDKDAVQAYTDAHAYIAQRAAAYPDFREYLDGIVKGDAAQVQKYIADCLAVKARFPK